MVVLNGVLPLGDIRDVEKLCDRIVAQALGQHVSKRSSVEVATAVRHGLSYAERDDLLAYLIGCTWELWLRYDSTDDGRGRKTFSGFAVPQLRMRVIDWQRRKLGRGAGPGEWGVLSTGELDECELERVLGSRGGDDPADRVSSLDGLLAAGGRSSRRVEHAGRRGSSRRVA